MDIYFLLDISASMKPIQDRLVQVPEKLIEVREALKIFCQTYKNIYQLYYNIDGLVDYYGENE